ncbi:MAG: hypothetical protein CVU05_11815 [Bacteroidetes bacterium HGW-Bacteroidetes-21]|jgi:aspartyl/asparaginyl beta-hydroxylase (cupin superfamily)|nr:MAG: hypothetical protein CVU05_11815 [Bacteroidetes bacterium HGW-Bacteroidetes-21]
MKVFWLIEINEVICTMSSVRTLLRPDHRQMDREVFITRLNKVSKSASKLASQFTFNKISEKLILKFSLWP